MNSRRGLEALRCDIFRLRGRARLLDVLFGLVWLRNFRPIVTLRLIGVLCRSRWPGARFAAWPLKLLHRWFCAAAAMDLPHTLDVGPGLCITHGWGLVVSPGAAIGANCTLLHGVTIGQKDRIHANGERTIEYPVLEDECWVGPGACVLGNVRVGRGAIIGACAVVVRDVPPHSVVVGNPARVIRKDVVADVFNRVPDLSECCPD